jgi:hypothetical protein
LPWPNPDKPYLIALLPRARTAAGAGKASVRARDGAAVVVGVGAGGGVVGAGVLAGGGVAEAEGGGGLPGGVVVTVTVAG